MMVEDNQSIHQIRMCDKLSLPVTINRTWQLVNRARVLYWCINLFNSFLHWNQPTNFVVKSEERDILKARRWQGKQLLAAG